MCHKQTDSEFVLEQDSQGDFSTSATGVVRELGEHWKPPVVALKIWMSCLRFREQFGQFQGYRADLDVRAWLHSFTGPGSGCNPSG